MDDWTEEEWNRTLLRIASALAAAGFACEVREGMVWVAVGQQADGPSKGGLIVTPEQAEELADRLDSIANAADDTTTIGHNAAALIRDCAEELRAEARLLNDEDRDDDHED